MATVRQLSPFGDRPIAEQFEKKLQELQEKAMKEALDTANRILQPRAKDAFELAATAWARQPRSGLFDRRNQLRLEAENKRQGEKIKVGRALTVLKRAFDAPVSRFSGGRTARRSVRKRPDRLGALAESDQLDPRLLKESAQEAAAQRLIADLRGSGEPQGFLDIRGRDFFTPADPIEATGADRIRQIRAESIPGIFGGLSRGVSAAPRGGTTQEIFSNDPNLLGLTSFTRARRG